MALNLKYTQEAQKQLDELSKQKSSQKRFKAVIEALNLLSANPSHPSLHTHKYDSITGPEKVEVFEAYAENNRPGAYRIFWCYYPPKKKSDKQGSITILAITPHP